MALSTRSRLTRRNLLRAAAVLASASAIPLLAACSGQSSSASPTAAPARTKAAAAPTTAAATTAPTTTAAAPTTAAATPSAATASAPTPVATLVEPKSVKISGTFKVVQQQDWNSIHNQYLHDLVAKTAQQYNWPLELSYEAGFAGGTSFNQKMAAAVSTGTGPDLLWGAYDTFTLWYLNTLQPVDNMVNSFIKRFGEPSPGFVPGNKIAGKWYSVPYFTRTGGWWARKSWFTDAGIDALKINNFDGWKDACLKISDGSKHMWGWGNTTNRSVDGENNVSTMWFEAGNRLTDETGTKVTFNTDLSVEAFNYIKDIYTNPKYKPMLPPGVLGWDDVGNDNAWNAGTIGFTSNAGTLFAAGLKTVPKIGNDTILIPQPAMPIGQKQTLVGAAGGATFYLLQGAKNPDAAKALLEIMLAPAEQQKLWGYSQGYVTPAYAWGWDSEPVKTSPNNVDLIFKEYAFHPNAFAWYQPAPNPLLWVNGVSNAVVFTDTFASILKGTPVKQAVADAQTKIEAIGRKFNWK